MPSRVRLYWRGSTRATLALGPAGGRGRSLASRGLQLWGFSCQCGALNGQDVRRLYLVCIWRAQGRELFEFGRAELLAGVSDLCSPISGIYFFLNVCSKSMIHPARAARARAARGDPRTADS
eukprot:scaffold27178_cov56-Phaeocystis_antarctica.AAC.1